MATSYDKLTVNRRRQTTSRGHTGCGSSLRRAFLGWRVSTSLASAAVLVGLASARPAHADRQHTEGFGSSLLHASLEWRVSTSLASAAALGEPASTRSTNTPLTDVNDTDKAHTVQAGNQRYAHDDHESSWSSSLQRASRAAALALLAHDRVRAFRSPNSVTFQNDLSYSLAQLAAAAMGGDDNGYPSGITELPGWRTDCTRTVKCDHRHLAYAEDALIATAQPTHASKQDNTMQFSIEHDFNRCPARHGDGVIQGNAIRGASQYRAARSPTSWRQSTDRATKQFPQVNRTTGGSQ